MQIKNVIKKIIPSSVKQMIKKEIGGSTEYVIHVADRNKLQNRFAVVTGGSGAIGSAICFRLAMEGAKVAVCGRSINKISYVIKNIKKNGGEAVPVVLDVTDEKAVSKSMKILSKEHGTIDILINNAGGSARENSKLFSEQDFDTIRNVLDINLHGAMLCTHYALKYMNTDKARIINMGSVVGIQGKSGMTDYAASKAAIVGFTRSLAIELGKRNITVNCVSPGWVNRTVFDHGSQPTEGNINCMGRSGKTDEVGALVAFLVSDEAAYITGQNIIIDGGRSLGLWGDT